MTLDESIAAAVREALEAELPRAVREALRVVQGAAAAPVEYLKTAEAARVAQVAEETIREWVRDGRLPRHNAGRELRVRRDELEAFLDGQGPKTAGSVEQATARAAAILGRHSKAAG